MNIKPLVTPLIVAVLVVGAVWFLARKPAEQLGNTDGGAAVVAIGEINPELVGQTVAIEGTIEQECPHSGCWAVIKDATGSIRIDTQKGGFALPLHREGSHVRVVGAVVLTEGGDVEISAESAEL